MIPRAYLSEIFSSLQGEGIYQGVRQIFIRLAGCNLNCDYCDTPQSRIIGNGCLVMGKKIPNPVPAEDLLGLLTNSRDHLITLSPYQPIHSVSLTGGEPLLQVNFLVKLTPALKKLGLKIYLETNGTLPEELKKIVDLVDYIAMDIKLPSATGKDLFSKHYEFLSVLRSTAKDERISENRLQIAPARHDLAGGNCKLQIKIVLTEKTLDEEIKKSINLIKKINPDIPLVLQPVTAINGVYPPERKKIISWFTLAKGSLRDVRIIPQKHVSNAGLE